MLVPAVPGYTMYKRSPKGPASAYDVKVVPTPPTLWPVFLGHCARKWVSLLQMPQRMTCPSDPMGFLLRPLPFPVLRRLPLGFPFPPKKTASTAESSMLAKKSNRLEPFPLPLPRALPFPLRRKNFRTRRTGFCMCFLQRLLACW